ncbi:hypothetical protein AB3331_04830 [Streptococcus sp. H49]|uniref:hypothetical protein n=1 Tax=Streptococcus huangxiaojuni TaxID=3237239 RepID=UPI0034A0EF49
MKTIKQAGLEADYLKLIEETSDLETSYNGGTHPTITLTTTTLLLIAPPAY